MLIQLLRVNLYLIYWFTIYILFIWRTTEIIRRCFMFSLEILSQMKRYESDHTLTSRNTMTVHTYIRVHAVTSEDERGVAVVIIRMVHQSYLCSVLRCRVGAEHVCVGQGSPNMGKTRPPARRPKVAPSVVWSD